MVTHNGIYRTFIIPSTHLTVAIKSICLPRHISTVLQLYGNLKYFCHLSALSSLLWEKILCTLDLPVYKKNVKTIYEPCVSS